MQVNDEKKREKYNILILSNPENEEFIEDEYIANSFREDGHLVTILWVNYDEKLDEKFDIIIRRNTWVEKEEEKMKYKLMNNKLEKRLKEKSIKTVNLEGLDGRGKEYLCRLYNEGRKVIPTVDKLKYIDRFGKVLEYVLKEKDSFGSGLGQKLVTENELEREFKEGYLIQPKMKFESEVQCYFVGNKLMYVYEYTPSKYPDYPIPQLIELDDKQKELAYEFAKISKLEVGFQRIDFLKLENDELILLEIEDNSPYMDLDKLDSSFRNIVLNEYKRNIYNYLKS